MAKGRRKAGKASSTAGDRGATTVVYIHGIGSQAPPEETKRAWDFALFGGDMGERTCMAYWADIRHPKATRTRAIAAADLDDEGEGVEPSSLVAEARVPAGARRRAEAYAERILGSVATVPGGLPAPRARRTRGRGGLLRRKVLPLPSWLRRPLTEWITRALIRDTAAYFFDPGQRRRMQNRLKECLLAAPGPVRLVAHSQGSIISYDVLHELGDAVAVEMLVTIGSPLGLTEVQDHLTKPLKVPPSVAAWRNFADVLDPVALDKGLAGDFAPSRFIKDAIVVNADSLRLAGFNPHSATGYLATRKVRQAVETTVDPVRRFFVAKDVAAQMADPVSRHPVLIEIEDPAHRQPEGAPATLAGRRDAIVAAIRDIVGKEAEEASIDPLRRFVAARLTTAEIHTLARRRKDLNAYCVWKNSTKRKLLRRSVHVVQAGAAHVAYAALGEGISWAVLDTGIQGNHPHFKKGTIAAAWGCTVRGDPRRIGDPRDPDGHGTHVAGIIAGREDAPSPTVSGVAPSAKLHAYKVLDDDGDGEDAWIIKALDHIAHLNDNSSGLAIHGVNLSLGGSFDPDVYGCGHSPICAELRRLWQQGVVVCIASGNEGAITVKTTEGDFDLNTDLSIGDPANLEESIGVGSVNADKPHLFGISYFSSRGPTADGRAKPDVVAPGERILSCNAGYRGRGTDAYIEQSGTSMACPHVSGLIAAFLSVRREFIGRPDLVKRILKENCTDLGRDRYHQGSGLPNLMRMLANT